MTARFGGDSFIRARNALNHPSSLLLTSTLASMVLGILSAALQARILGPVGRGELAVAMVPGTLLAMLFSAGLPDFAARKAARSEDPNAVSLLALVMSLAIGLVTAAPYLAFALLHTGSDSARALLVMFALTVAPAVYGYVLVGLGVGAGAWRVVASMRVAPMLITVAILGGMILLNEHNDVLAVGMALIATSYAPPFAYLLMRGLRPHGRLTVRLFREALSFAGRGWPAGAVALVNQRIDLVMMTLMSGGRDLGYYAVATTLAAVLNAVANAIAMPMRNRVSRGQLEVIPTFVAGTTWSIAGLSVLVIVLLPTLVRVVLGVQYLPAIPVMTVLLVCQIPLAAVVILTQSLVGAGHPGAPLVGEIVALGSTIALILGTFGLGGIIAAAVSTGIGNLLSLVVLVFRVRRDVYRFPIVSLFWLRPRRLYEAITRRQVAQQI